MIKIYFLRIRIYDTFYSKYLFCHIHPSFIGNILGVIGIIHNKPIDDPSTLTSDF